MTSSNLSQDLRPRFTVIQYERTNHAQLINGIPEVFLSDIRFCPSVPSQVQEIEDDFERRTQFIAELGQGISLARRGWSLSLHATDGCKELV